MGGRGVGGRRGGHGGGVEALGIVGVPRGVETHELGFVVLADVMVLLL